MKKVFSRTLFLGTFLGALTLSAVAQINPTDDRYIQVFQPSFSRLTPQGPAVGGTGGGTSSSTVGGGRESTRRLQNPEYRAS